MTWLQVLSCSGDQLSHCGRRQQLIARAHVRDHARQPRQPRLPHAALGHVGEKGVTAPAAVLPAEAQGPRETEGFVEMAEPRGFPSRNLVARTTLLPEASLPALPVLLGA